MIITMACTDGSTKIIKLYLDFEPVKESQFEDRPSDLNQESFDWTFGLSTTNCCWSWIPNLSRFSNLNRKITYKNGMHFFCVCLLSHIKANNLDKKEKGKQEEGFSIDEFFRVNLLDIIFCFWV